MTSLSFAAVSFHFSGRMAEGVVSSSAYLVRIYQDDAYDAPIRFIPVRSIGMGLRRY